MDKYVEVPSIVKIEHRDMADALVQIADTCEAAIHVRGPHATVYAADIVILIEKLLKGEIDGR